MPLKRHKPRGKYIIQALDYRLPTPDESASKRYWRSFSQNMWSLYVAWLNSLMQPYVWENWTDDIYELLADYTLPQEPPGEECPECPEPEPCPECPDCPDPEPEQPRPGANTSIGNSGLSPFGRITGLTADQLEEMLGMSIRDIKVENGILYKRYWGDDCDCWHKVGSILQAVSGTVDQPLSSYTQEQLQELVNAGGFPTLPPPEYLEPVLSSGDALRCSKATATKLVMQRFILDMRNFVDDAIASPLGQWYWILTEVVAFFTSGIPVVSAVTTALKDKQLQDVRQELTDILADDEFWNNFVCLLTEQMTFSDSFTGQDVTNFFSVFVSQQLNLTADVLELIMTIDPVKFQKSINYTIGYAGCECDNYLPYGYTPIYSDNYTVRFAKQRQYNSNAADQTTYEHAFNAVTFGERDSESGWFKAVEHLNTGTDLYVALSVVLELAPGVTITAINLEWKSDLAITWGNTASGIKLWEHYRNPDSAPWVQLENIRPPDGSLSGLYNWSGTSAKAYWFIVYGREMAAGTPDPNLRFQIRVSGTRSDGSVFNNEVVL